MQKGPHCLLTLLVSLGLSGCLAGQLPVGTGVAGKEKTVRADGAGKVQPPGELAGVKPLPPQSVSPGKAAKQTLTGLVRVPSQLVTRIKLVSNNGGSIVSNNGGGVISDKGNGIVSNNGGSYRVTAVAQVPAANTEVALRDAAGRAVLDSEGKPLTAVTDAQGRYAFDATLPTRNLIAEVQLQDGFGALSAVVPREGTDTKQVDVDFVSTLTTAYVLDQYVKTLSDPVTDFEKLPADVEAETRRKAAVALAASSSAPEKLTAEAVVATVDALRKQNAPFNAQMETVKRIFIVAGQADLGAGQAAAAINLGRIMALMTTPEGDLWVSSSYSKETNRVWKIPASGSAETVIGNGFVSEAGPAGLLAKEAGFLPLKGLSRDAQNRLFILEDRDAAEANYHEFALMNPSNYRRVSRLEADGRVTALPGAPANIAALLPGPTLLTDDGALLEFNGDGTTKELARLANWPTLGTLAVGSHRAQTSGRDSKGRIYVQTRREIVVNNVGEREVYVVRFDPAGGAAVTNPGLPEAAPGTRQLALDPSGHLLTWEPAASRLLAYPPDAPPRTLLEGGATLKLTGALMRADGSAYVVHDFRQIYHVRDGRAVLVAGTTGAAIDDQAALIDPRGVTATANGFYVADAGKRQVIRFAADGKATVAVGADPFAMPAGIDAIFERYPIRLRADAQDNLTFINGLGEVWRVAASGTATRLTQQATGGEKVTDLAVAPDGTLYYVGPPTTDRPSELRRLAPGGAWEALTGGDPIFVSGGLKGANAVRLAVDATGGLHVGVSYTDVKPDGSGFFGTIELRRRTADGLVRVKTLELGEEHLTSLAVDSRGRYYFGQSVSPMKRFPPLPPPGLQRVMRYDPATDRLDIIAGKGGQIFNGAGVDESLDFPSDLAFDPAGNLLILDKGHRQVKRVPADKLL